MLDGRSARGQKVASAPAGFKHPPRVFQGAARPRGRLLSARSPTRWNSRSKPAAYAVLRRCGGTGAGDGEARCVRSGFSRGQSRAPGLKSVLRSRRLNITRCRGAGPDRWRPGSPDGARASGPRGSRSASAAHEAPASGAPFTDTPPGVSVTNPPAGAYTPPPRRRGPPPRAAALPCWGLINGCRAPRRACRAG